MEGFLLIAAVLAFASIWACKAGYKFGVPILLVFLFTGMFFGDGGLKLIMFDNFHTASTIGSIALCVILFSGGMDTKFADIKPVLSQGIILATIGVALTAIITGFVIKGVDMMFGGVLGVSVMAGLLLASTMASTDSASVFSILRSQNLNLKNNLRPLLESESGSNDPVAYIMTVTLIGIVNQGDTVEYSSVVLDIIIKLVMGGAAGYLVARLFVSALNRLNIDNASLYPIAVLSGCLFIYSVSYFVGGNSYLAVYIGGLVIGNSNFVHKRATINFFDGLTWLCQLIMFLTLGLLVSPHELWEKLIPSIIISLVMIFISRPLSVFLCLAPFKRSFREKAFISWVGLKGAAPIIFAIMLLTAGTPNAKGAFNIVFMCTLISLLVQGMSLSWMARKLDLIDTTDELSQPKNFDLEFSDDIKSVTTEIMLTQDDLDEHGRFIKDLPLPENTLVVMIKRGGKYFVPKGKTELSANDHLLLITDDKDLLIKTLTANGISLNNVKPDKMENSSIIEDLKQVQPVSTLKDIGKTVGKMIGK